MRPDLQPEPEGHFPRNALLIDGIRRARARGTDALVRVTLPLRPLDPWKLLSHPLLDGRVVFAWHEDERVILAVDALRFLDIPAEGRFPAAARALSRARAATVTVPLADPAPTAVPFLVGGFQFSSREATSGPWAGTPPSHLYVPRVVVVRDGAGTFLALHEPVPVDHDDDTVAADLLRHLRRVLDALDAPVAPSTARANPLLPSDIGHDAFVRLAAAARDATRGPTLQKVVIARSERFEAPPGAVFDPVATADALRQRQPGCTTFAVIRPERAFVGATPEPLARVRDGVLRTVALAGTARRDPSVPDAELERALLDSAKDRHEQHLVVGAIREALAPIVKELPAEAAPRARRTADLIHLETPIEGPLRDGVTLLDALERLHPTPAVGGLPYAPALRWIREHEGFDRGGYAAPVGWIDIDGDGCFVVAIRSVLLKGTEAFCFAGCGIVPDSEPESEWQETRAKLQTACRSLAVKTA